MIRNEWVAGMGLVCLAGAMQGGFAFPMKFTRGWGWENIWLASSFLGLMVFPWLIALATIPMLLEALSACPTRPLMEVFLFGAGWGVGGMLFGLGVHRVGLSLTLALVIGLTSIVGCVVPLALFQPAQFFGATGVLVIFAVVSTLGGLALCALAGRAREQKASDDPAAAVSLRAYWAGLGICILSGLLSPLFNFALIRGEPVIAAASRMGASRTNAPNLIWAIAMSGGMIPTMVYCGWLLLTQRTWKDFRKTAAHDGALAIAMGALFAFGNALYGMGAENLGAALGAIVGWPVFMALQVLTGNALGIASGEWRGANRQTMWLLLSGNALLVIAVFFIGRIGPG
jgi:L-rhamnose-H+ transport protein